MPLVDGTTIEPNQWFAVAVPPNAVYPSHWDIHVTATAGGITRNATCSLAVEPGQPPVPPIVEVTTHKGCTAIFGAAEPIRIWLRALRRVTINGDLVRADGGSGWSWARDVTIEAGQWFIIPLLRDFIYPYAWKIQVTATAGVAAAAQCSFVVSDLPPPL